MFPIDRKPSARDYLDPVAQEHKQSSSLAGDVELGRRTPGELQALREMRNPLARQSSVPRRASPVLANARRLVSETRDLLTGETEALPDNLIATTYGTRADKRYYENIADNLKLDINMCFEEELQRQIEHDPHFLDAVKRVVAHIHTKLDIRSMSGQVSPDLPIPPSAKAERERYILAKLKDYYPDSELEDFLNSPNWTENANFKPFVLDGKRDDREFRPSEIQEAEGLFKLLKMLKTQMPYFGGSVEYQEHIENSLEFWMYHLSTLTKDPDRQYSLSDRDLGQLMKPLKDYRTDPAGLVPFMNQRNLGTGVAEADWGELPRGLRKEIEDRLNVFAREVGERGDNSNPGAALRLWSAYARVGRQLDKDPMKLTPGEVWDSSDEDVRKTIYGDICKVPWSDAHLIEGAEGWEQTYEPSLSSEDVRSRLPRREEPGLMNVAGVFGNILETPLIAGSKFMEEGGRRIERLRVQGRLDGKLVGVPQGMTLLNDFVEKHTNWHNNAIDSHKPIIGGISGHTLGYLNMYAEALNKSTPEERDGLPSMETLRAVMLAGLIGFKRHHSYDEVMAASTAVSVDSGRLSYSMPAGYSDVFSADDQHIVDCANRAKRAVRDKYLTYDDRTVFAEVSSRAGPASGQLAKAITGYIDKLDTKSASMLKMLKNDITLGVRNCVAPPYQSPLRPNPVGRGIAASGSQQASTSSARSRMQDAPAPDASLPETGRQGPGTSAPRRPAPPRGSAVGALVSKYERSLAQKQDD